MTIQIHGKSFDVSADEFMDIHPEMTPLKIKNDLAELDREIAFIDSLSVTMGFNTLVNYGISHGGYTPILLSSRYAVYVYDQHGSTDSIVKNADIHKAKININTDLSIHASSTVIRIESHLQVTAIATYPIIICNMIPSADNYKDYTELIFSDISTSRRIYINKAILEQFSTLFSVEGPYLLYDNLINLLIMIKDAGPEFYRMLEHNLPYIDRWTILDTGSTDGTQDTVLRILSGKPGTLYQEPFINFRDSRNRLLELAGDSCAFNIMLDDTYYINGDLRSFLMLVRGDDVADSYSVYIKDTDTTYSSNRITKPSRALRYKYKIHEIIEPNTNVAIPIDRAYITDRSSPYMAKRTKSRKLQDLEWLKDEIKDDPDDPRAYYYIAETYYNIEQYQDAFEYYAKRRTMAGFSEEVQDSLYKMAVIGELYLSFPWERCHQLYIECFEYNPKRSESLFMVGRHYVSTGLKHTGYMYLTKAFELGFPQYSTMNVKHSQINEHIPRTLLPLCYEFGDYVLGEECAKRIMHHKRDLIAHNWFRIYHHLNMSITPIIPTMTESKPIACFICPGGWNKWDGSTLHSKGLGGSETCVIKFAEEISKLSYNMYVFCECEQPMTYRNVNYRPLSQYPFFLSRYRIDLCVIHRYPEYIPLTIKNGVDVHLMLHDLIDRSTIIPISDSLKGVLCLSEWHKRHFIDIFPQFAYKTHVVSYGTDLSSFPVNPKKKYSFIYSSFPNRGLIHLLELFPIITASHPEATLDIFCNLEPSSYLEYYEDNMKYIRQMISEQSNVTNHGWVAQGVLFDYWSRAHIWLYPCHFEETHCMTALEAAMSNTLAITTDLAALNETVGDRGIIIPGDPASKEWRERALEAIDKVFDGSIDEKGITGRNYEWIRTKGYDRVVRDFMSIVLK